jgi:hypothetical protein
LGVLFHSQHCALHATHRQPQGCAIERSMCCHVDGMAAE